MLQVDLHIHSYYSDGTMSPKEIIDCAKKKKLNYIAITDHNEIAGSLEATKIDSSFVIPGVELDALIDGIDVHILAYNFDINNKEFRSAINHTREMLMQVDDELIYKLAANNFPNISINDYEVFKYDRRKGGWKALQYLISLGIINSVEGCFILMKQYDHSHANLPFYSVEEMISFIHKAGGIAILAHPGKTFPKDKMEYYLNKILAYKIDGIEAFYPKHDENERNYFYNFAKRNNLLITCGCDCHGSFQSTSIGEVKVLDGKLNLKGIIKDEGIIN